MELMTVEVDIDCKNKSNIIKIMLAEDHPLMRFALKEILEKEPTFKIIAEAVDGEEVIKLVDTIPPDIIIMDIGMPKIDGIEATRQINIKYPNLPILALTVQEDFESVFKILEAGAKGYLTKSAFSDEIVWAVHMAISGDMVLSPSVSKELVKYAIRNFGKPVIINKTERFSAKEIEIVKLAAKGLSNKDIAQHFSMSERTVKNCFSQIFLKLGVTSRTEAVIECVRTNLLSMKDVNLRE